MPDFQVPVPRRRPERRPTDTQGGSGRTTATRGTSDRGNQARVEGTGVQAPGTQTAGQQDGGLDAMVRSTQELATDVGRQGTMDTVLQEFDSITLSVPVETKKGVKLTASVTIQAPYRINYTSTDYAVGHSKYPGSRLPTDSAKGAPEGLGDAVTNAKLGKGSPVELQLVLQAALDQGKVKIPKVDDKLVGADGKLDAAGTATIEGAIQGYLKAGSGRLIGVDCSGFIYQIVTRMVATKDNPDPKWMQGIMDTGTSSLKTENALTTIKAASTLRTGDLLLHARHVEMVKTSTAMSEEDAKKLSGVTVYKGAQIFQLEVMESSPNNDRQGPTSSVWVVVQGATTLSWYKQSGKNWTKKTVTARRPDVLGEVPAIDKENAPGAKAKTGKR